MMSTDDRPPYFGKHQKIVAKLYYFSLYFVFYFCPLHCLYALLTLDHLTVAFYLLVVVVQWQVKKNQKYVDFLNNIIQMRKALKIVSIRYEENIGPEEKCLFGIHPHGILTAGLFTFMNFPEGPFSNVVILASRAMLSLPFVGLFLKLWGVESVDSNNMKHLMKKQVNIGLSPGGFEEATLTVRDELRIYIKERKGFIKYALQNNYTIYPVLSINEHKMFWTFRYFLNFRLWLNKLKIPGVIYFNPYSFGGFPPTYMGFQAIVGKGIRGKHYQHGQTPTSEQINEAHSRYISEITRMYEVHKEEIGTPLKIF